MSFALEVKEEIVKNKDFNVNQKKCFLSGFIKHNGELIYTKNKFGLKISSISNSVIRYIFTLLKELHNGNVEISIIESKMKNQNKVFNIFVYDNVKELLTSLNIYDFSKNEKIIFMPYNDEKDLSLVWSYIGGVFIACGSVNSPSTSNYHLEFQIKDKESADYLVNLINKNNFNFKVIEKRNKFVCYIKKSNDVSDVLKKMGAINSVYAFENKKAERELRNSVNRYLNIDIYNTKKSVVASNEQVDDINLIKEKDAFNLLSEKCQVLAELRLQNPGSSYSELVELMEENDIEITKSGISNLFKNIKKLAKELEE